MEQEELIIDDIAIEFDDRNRSPFKIIIIGEYERITKKQAKEIIMFLLKHL